MGYGYVLPMFFCSFYRSLWRRPIITECTGLIFTKFSECGHDQSDFIRDLSSYVMMVTNLARIGEHWHTPPSFCALSFHNGWEDRNTNARVNTADDPSTSDKNLVNFDPVTLEFCRRVRAGPGYTLGGFAMHF